MMHAQPMLSSDLLLERIDGVRRLARQLVRDAADADDLVSEVVTAAIERPTPVVGDPGGWIFTVLRNRARNLARSSSRRAAREAAAARPEGQPDQAGTAEAVERYRSVVGAVGELDEPYATVVYLRYFEELKPAAIARRTGASVETVKKQLVRGKLQLRVRLENEFGGDGRWAVALLPVAGADVLRGAGATSFMLYAAAAVLAVGGVSFALVDGALDDPQRSESMGANVVLDEAGDAARSAAPDLAPVAAAAVESAEPSPELQQRTSVAGSEPAAAPARATVLALVIDENGDPLPTTSIEWTTENFGDWMGSAALQHSPGSAIDRAQRLWTLQTDERGRLILDADKAGRAKFDHHDLARGDWSVPNRDRLVLWGWHNNDFSGEKPLILVAYPAVELGGIVVDSAGRPAAEANFLVDGVVGASSDGLQGHLPEGLQFSPRSGQTAVDGTFSGLLVPRHPDFRLAVSADGPVFAHPETPNRSTNDLRIELDGELPSAAPMIVGRVLEASGRPAERAEVRFGYYEARTDADGRFELEVESLNLGDRLGARSLRDGRFVVDPAIDRRALQSSEGPLEVELTLPERLLSLSGRLLTSAGEPAAGFDVGLINPTPMGPLSGSFEATRPRDERGSSFRTDAQGRFELPRLADRAYDLRFLEPGSMRYSVVREVTAAPHERTFYLEAPRPQRIAGQVRDFRGTPLAGVEVLPGLMRSNSNDVLVPAGAPVAVTDAEGRFDLGLLDPAGLGLLARLPDPLDPPMVSHDLADSSTLAEVELTLTRTAWVELRIPAREGSELAADTYERIEFLDAAGQPLQTRPAVPGANYPDMRHDPAKLGQTPRLRVPESAVEVVWYRSRFGMLTPDAEILAREPVAPDPDREVVITL